MPHDDAVVRAGLRAVGRDRHITSLQRLAGGLAVEAWQVCYADGTRLVAKTIDNPPRDLFAVEAEGLAALRSTGQLRTPDVISVTRRMLLLSELPAREDDEGSWESFAISLAGLHHATVHDRFGWHHDGCLGLLRQDNHWTVNGHEFFAEHRLLRYLREPVEPAIKCPASRSIGITATRTHAY